MHVLALRVELHLPRSRSLKERRSILRPIVEGCRNRHPVAVAEVDHQDTWQRAALGICAVSASSRHAREVIDEVERFVWSFPEAEVIDTHRAWLEMD
jgi:uncharacterized protein YlxP (DUF503 family)